MRIAIPLILLLAIVGCDGPLQVEAPERPRPTERVSNDRYDPTRSGVVAGVVRWIGPAPTVEPVSVVGFRLGEPLVARRVPNPNAPRIVHGALGSAFVRLEGVDPRRAKSAPAKAVELRLDADGITIEADGTAKRVAGAPLGSQVTIVNRIAGIGGIRARGAEFFAHLFPEQDRETTRTLERTGWTTFTSASGQYWAVADLFACEHPYFATTDAEGRFRFKDAPDGDYELVAWHPHWKVAGHELDPESGVVARWTYEPAVELRTTVRIVAGATATVTMAMGAADFERGR